MTQPTALRRVRRMGHTVRTQPTMGTPAVSAKQEVAQLLSQLSDDATLEDIQYHVCVLEKIKRGRADVAAGRSYTTEQARERLARWLPS